MADILLSDIMNKRGCEGSPLVSQLGQQSSSAKPEKANKFP